MGAKGHWIKPHLYINSFNKGGSVNGPPNLRNIHKICPEHVRLGLFDAQGQDIWYERSCTAVVPNHVPGCPPNTAHFPCLLNQTPDLDHQLVCSDSKTWNGCVRQRRDAKCAVLGGLQDVVGNHWCTVSVITGGHFHYRCCGCPSSQTGMTVHNNLYILPVYGLVLQIISMINSREKL